MFNFVPDAALLQAIFSQAAAPAFLLGGIAAFIAILMSRIALLLAQIRALREIPDHDSDRAKLKAEVPHLKRRVFLLHRSAYLALLSGIATAFLLVVMGLSAFLGLHHVFGAGLLFGAAVILFIFSLVNFSREIRLALREIDQL